MPVIRITLSSQRNRPLTDSVDRFMLESKRSGVIRDDIGIEPTSKRFTVDAAPDDYTLHLEVSGFHSLIGKRFKVKSGGPANFPVTLQHRCTDLPTFAQLTAEQQAWLATYDKKTPPAGTWTQLSDNECCTFFQVTYALLNTSLANGRALASYIRGIDQIGGARITNTLPDGKRKSATGWRLHTHIEPADAASVEASLLADGYKKDKIVVDTHTKFGFIRSYREFDDQPQPHFQFVFNRDRSMSDVDLDDPAHNSAPEDIYPHLIKRFPAVAAIYTVA